MSTSLETKLRVAAGVYAPLVALLGSPLRWWDTQLVQGSTYPAIVVQLISGSNDYVFNGRLTTGTSRVQFTIWDTDAERARTVEDTLTSFLDQFNGTGIPGMPIYPNRVVLTRQGLFSATQPIRYQRLVDAMIFSNDSL